VTGEHPQTYKSKLPVTIRVIVLEKNAQTLFATSLGAVLVLIGILGFLMNPILGIFEVNTLHNVIHLVSGAILICAGVWSGTGAATTTNKVFGIVYLLVAILGFAMPDLTASLLSMEHADHLLADNMLHAVIAAAALIVGFGMKTT
jgi:hypothetical protein